MNRAICPPYFTGLEHSTLVSVGHYLIDKMMSWEESTNKMLHRNAHRSTMGKCGRNEPRRNLVDHAYCEQKAASSCISLIVNFYEFRELVDMLTPVVAEEWNHFERVMEQIRKRGFQFGKPRKDEYVIKLSGFVKKGGSRADQLVEYLLMNALIEARSCERFKLLSKNLEDEELKKFYYELMVSSRTLCEFHRAGKKIQRSY